MKKITQTHRELNVSEEKLNVQANKQKLNSTNIIANRTMTYEKKICTRLTTKKDFHPVD